jgi:NTE family protein
MGAVNASLVAKHQGDADRGAARLESFWRDTMTMPQPSNPFAAFLPQPYAAVWESLLAGNPRLFTPYFAGWPFLPPTAWLPTHFYSAKAMERTIAREFGGYQGSNPLLIVTAVDVEEGTSVAFDSAVQAVSIDHVAASCALPPWLPAKQIGDRSYWDGGLWSNTPLRDALQVLQNRALLSPDETYAVYIIDVFPTYGRLPQNLWELQGRVNEIAFGDKTDFDHKMSDKLTDHLSFVEKIDKLATGTDGELQKTIKAERQRLLSERRAPLRITPIRREALPNERISGGIDFSPERITALRKQGFANAIASLLQASGKAPMGHEQIPVRRGEQAPVQRGSEQVQTTTAPTTSSRSIRR